MKRGYPLDNRARLAIRSSRLARWSVATGAAVLATLLSGCTESGVRVPPGAEELQPCPVRRIDVTTLGDMGEPGCDLAGTTLIFPGGKEILVGAPGWSGAATDSRSGEWVRAAAWGVPGVGAVQINGTTVTVWGSTQEAVDLQLQLLAISGIED